MSTMKDIHLINRRLKDGREIDLVFRWDIDGNDPPGWTLHQIDAFCDGEEAGYLKISYKPKERFTDTYPEPFVMLNFMGKSKGWCIGLKDHLDAKAPKCLSQLPPIEALGRVNSYFRHLDWQDLKTISEDQARQALLEIEAKLRKSSGPVLREHIRYHVDKPMVDFIHANDARDLMQQDPGLSQSEAEERSYRGKGLSTILYQAGTLWMRETGLPGLYASGCQTKEANRAWERMESNGLPIEYIRCRRLDGPKENREYERRFINGRKLKAQLQAAAHMEAAQEPRRLVMG